MELDFLKELGFTAGEIKVYDALLGLGSSTSGRIIKRSGISSSKVYPILDRLAEKGMVTHVIRSGVKHFRPADPEKLLDLVKERKKKIESQESEIQRVLPGLLARAQAGAARHEAEVYEGYGGVKSYFMQTLKHARKDEERLVFGAVTGYPLSEPARRFFRFYDRQRARAGIKVRVIYSEEARGRAKGYERSALTRVRYLPQLTLSSVGIQKDSVDILIWTKETSVVFVIRSPEVAETFKGYFEVLWKTAKK